MRFSMQVFYFPFSHAREIECKAIWLEKQKVACEQYFKTKYKYFKL